MSAANHNLTIDQGSDFVIDLVIKDEGVIKNLTGYSARAQMRATKSASTIAATFTCTVTDANNGEVKIELPNATTSAISPGKYYYDLELYTASDVIVSRLMQGTVILTPEVTR